MESLRDAIYKVYPETVQVQERIIGQEGAFEIAINGKLAYSYLITRKYPSNKQVLKTLQEVIEGKPLNTTIKPSSPCCLLC